MVNQQIVNYLKKEEAEGYSEEQLKEVLLENGYDPKEIQEAIEYVRESKSKQKSSKDKAQTKVSGIKKRNPILALVLSFVTFGIYILYWLITTALSLRKNTEEIPHPILIIVPFVNIYFLWKFFVGVKEITGHDNITLFILWIFLSPVSIYLTQKELNKLA